MNLFCLFTGHDWINTVSVDSKPTTNGVIVNGTKYTGSGLFDFMIKKKRICKKCGYKEHYTNKGWEKQPLTKEELREEKIKKILK